jgi:DNA-binding transcriptional LysR family regulator
MEHRMHRRYHHINIPTEIVRTIVVISEAGSFSKAGEKLGLSQPAISAQVKRLQVMVGGNIFEKVSGGVSFTPKGKLVLAQARKFLEANDQILSIGGAVKDGQPIRLGLSSLFVEEFLSSWRTAKHRTDQVSFICDHSGELAKSLVDGYLDVACLVNPPDDVGEPVFLWEENFVWVRSRDFVLRHGSPIPLIGWPGSWQDATMINAVESAGLAYRVVFTSADHHARIAAVASAIGLMALPQRQAVSPLVIAKEYYLPDLKPLRAGIFSRPDAKSERIEQLVEALKVLSPSLRGKKLIA